MVTRNDYMYEAWRSMFQAAGAPPAAIPGLGAFNNPYAFSIQGAGAAMGMPPGLMQGAMGQQMQQFLPLALQLLTGDNTLAQRLTSNNRVTFGNVSRAQQSQAILGALNQTATGATQQNLAGALQASGLNDILGQFGVTGDDAAGFLMQAAPFMGPSAINMINRFDPAGGSLGLGTALYQATLAGTGNTRVNENTASILGEQFQRAFTQQRQYGGGEFSLLDVEATSGLNLPQMGVLMQQARARGLTGDVLAGSAGLSLVERLARGANEEMRPAVEDIAAQVREGGLTTAEALGRMQDRGLVSSTRIQEEREAAIQENIQRDQPRLEQLSRGVTQAGSIFESLQDNIPALLEQLENLTGNLQNVDQNEIRQALANFQSLVEISGTTAEVLSEQAQIVASRVGVSFERGARLATDINMTATRLQETGLSVGDARVLAEADLTFLENQALQTQRVQDLAVAAQFATGAGQERLQRAVRAGDEAFLANPLQALIDAGQVTDVEAAQSIQRDIAAGNRLTPEEIERALSSQGLEAGQVAISQIRSRALTRARASGVDLQQVGEDISRRFNQAAEASGIEGRLGDLDEAQSLEIAAISARVRSGEIGVPEAASLVSARFEVGALDPEDASRFFRSVGSTIGRRLTKAERTALGISSTFEISKEQREATRREQERIREQTNQQLLNPEFRRGLAGFLNVMEGRPDAGIGDVLEAALISGGVLIDEERFDQFSADQLTGEEADKIRTLQRRIQNAENPTEQETLRKELLQFASEIGGELGITVDQVLSPTQRQTRNRVREQLGIDRLPALSEQAMDASGRLAAANRAVESRKDVLEAAKEEALAARGQGGEARIAAERQLIAAQRDFESAESRRDTAKRELRELVSEDTRTSGESREEREDSEAGESRETRETRDKQESESREGSGTPKSYKLENARIVLETNFGELIGEMVDARLASGDLADRTEQTRGVS